MEDAVQTGERKADAPKFRVQSVAKAAQILFAVANDDQGLSRKEISKQAKLSAQTTYHMLHTLSQLGLVSRSEGGNYLLGFRVGVLAGGFRRQIADLQHVRKVLREIAEVTGESVYAVKFQEGEIVAVDMVQGRHPIRVVELPLGMSEDAFSWAAGKLLLAHASEEARKDFLARHPIRKLTPNTVSSVAKLERQLNEIRNNGYATQNEEFHPGLSSIATLLDDSNHEWALSIPAPSDRIQANLKKYVRAMKSTAKKIAESAE